MRWYTPMKNSIIHIMVSEEKFAFPFIKFVNNHFPLDKHLFVILGMKNDKFEKLISKNIIFIDEKIKYLSLILLLNYSNKIILHGLWSQRINQILFVNPWLYKKCYWVMWGGDFYFPEKQPFLQRYTIKSIGHFVTYIKGDYELAKKWYGAKGTYHECFMYSSNLYKEYNVIESKHETINIQIGNSADSTNNHIEILQRLSKYADEDIKIFIPLSYGDENYAKEVIMKGKKMFGNKFKPMVDFMPFNEYLKFLGSIDIAIFAHKRQQAMGNTITLLGLGKKVYMRSDVTPWKFLQDIDIKVFDVEKMELNIISEDVKSKNINKTKKYFSHKNLLNQWKRIINE